MVLLTIGAFRYSGVDTDIGSLPINIEAGAIFDAVDTLRKFVFNGTNWNEFVKGTGEINEMANVGVGTGLIFRNKLGVTFNVKSLIGGTNIDVVDNADDITISTTGASPLTTKGDIFGFSTVDERIPVGTDGQLLFADSSTSLGVKYGDLLITKGQLLTFDTALTELEVGTNDQVLTADSAEATGLKWADPTGGGGGITGLNPNSTILDYSIDITDYTTPSSATATSNGAGIPSFSDDYSSTTGWTTLGVNVTVDTFTTGAVNANSADTGSDNRVHKSLGLTLSDTEWFAQFEVTPILDNGSTSSFAVFTFTAGTQAITLSGTSQDEIGLNAIIVGSTALAVYSKNGTTRVSNNAGGDIFNYTNGVPLFINLIRLTSTTVQFQVFTDSNRTVKVHDATVTIQSGITGLNTLQHGTVSDEGAGRLFSMDGDNIAVFNNTTSIPPSDPNDAIDGNTATFWESLAGINQSITLDMGSVVNCYGLAYFISTAELATMTETQFTISSVTDTPPTFFDDFSTYANQGEADLEWVPADSLFSVNISTQVLETDNLGSGADLTVYHDLGAGNVSDTKWVLRMKVDFKTLTFASNLWNIIGISSVLGNDQVSQDFVGAIALYESASASAQAWAGASSDNAAVGSRTGGISGGINLGIQYIELIRDGSNLTFNSFSNANFTGLNETIARTIVGTVTGLRYIKFQNRTPGQAGGQLDAEIDNVQFFNNISVVTQEFGRLLRTINKSDLLPDVFNFIRFNGENTQFLKIEGSSGNTLVMAANELAVQLETDPPLTTLHGQFTINPTNENLALNGGDPTSAVIDDPSTNSMTLVNTVTQNDPVTGAMVMWQETLDANNDVPRSIFKLDGVFKEVRWF